MAHITRYAVLCKLPDDGRGEYSEEIEIIAGEFTGVATIKRHAQNIIDDPKHGYNPELRPTRVVTVGVVTIQSI